MPGEDDTLDPTSARAGKRARQGITGGGLTAYAVMMTETALLAGFHRHVPKPVEPSELIAIIASLTGRPNEDL